jgi:hypothetical protein
MREGQKILHISLFTVSTYMSILMFILIGNSLPTKIAMGVLALIFECTKIMDLHKAQGDSDWKLIYVSSYALKAILSVIASVGLILTLLSAQDYTSSANHEFVQKDISVVTDEVDYWDDELNKIDETISLLNDNLDRNPEGYGISSKAFVSQIQTLQDRKENYREKYSTAVNDRLSKLSEISKATIIVNPADMFIEIGSLVGVDPGKLRMIVFIAIMILIEVSLALTNFAPESISAKTSEMTESVIADRDDVSQKGTVNKSVKKSGVSSTHTNKMTDGMTIPPRGLKASLAIAHHQSLREKRGAKLMTQAELAITLNTSPVIINNMIRRHVKRIMMEKGFETYTELKGFLKKAC